MTGVTDIVVAVANLVRGTIPARFADGLFTVGSNRSFSPGQHLQMLTGGTTATAHVAELVDRTKVKLVVPTLPARFDEDNITLSQGSQFPVYVGFIGADHQPPSIYVYPKATHYQYATPNAVQRRILVDVCFIDRFRTGNASAADHIAAVDSIVERLVHDPYLLGHCFRTEVSDVHYDSHCAAEECGSTVTLVAYRAEQPPM